MRKVGITQAFHVYVVGIQSNRGLRRLTYGIRRRLPTLLLHPNLFLPFFFLLFVKRPKTNEASIRERETQMVPTWNGQLPPEGWKEGRVIVENKSTDAGFGADAL